MRNVHGFFVIAFVEAEETSTLVAISGEGINCYSSHAVSL